ENLKIGMIPRIVDKSVETFLLARHAGHSVFDEHHPLIAHDPGKSLAHQGAGSFMIASYVYETVAAGGIGLEADDRNTDLDGLINVRRQHFAVDRGDGDAVHSLKYDIFNHPDLLLGIGFVRRLDDESASCFHGCLFRLFRDDFIVWMDERVDDAKNECWRMANIISVKGQMNRFYRGRFLAGGEQQQQHKG